MFKRLLSTGLLLLACSMILTSCSKSPKPSSFQFSNQKKVQAAHHWEILANDLASDLSRSTLLKEKLTGPISITTNDNSPFTRATRSFLTTSFVNNGTDISNDANLKLSWSLQLVEHKTDRPVENYPALNTIVYALGYAGIYKRFDVNGVAEGLLATAVVLDIMEEFADLNLEDVPNNEIIINISLVDAENNILYRKSNIYYINALDKNHYCFTPDLPDSRPGKTKTYAVSN